MRKPVLICVRYACGMRPVCGRYAGFPKIEKFREKAWFWGSDLLSFFNGFPNVNYFLGKKHHSKSLFPRTPFNVVTPRNRVFWINNSNMYINLLKKTRSPTHSNCKVHTKLRFPSIKSLNLSKNVKIWKIRKLIFKHT